MEEIMAKGIVHSGIFEGFSVRQKKISKLKDKFFPLRVKNMEMEFPFVKKEIAKKFEGKNVEVIVREIEELQ